MIDPAIWGTLIVSAANDVYLSLSFEQENKGRVDTKGSRKVQSTRCVPSNREVRWK